MAYSAATGPALVAQMIGGGHGIWVWKTTEAMATVDANDYIDNGSALGMKLNDSVLVVDSTGLVTSFHRVESVTAGGAADISLGTSVGSASTGD